jgi:cyclopropane fatty-acyl-phospholipid synthase-like methyltransferase
MDMRAAESVAAWDVGRPQRAVYELEMAAQIGHEVIDVGCGIGEQALFLAERGHRVVGVDPSEVAIARAIKRARTRGLPAAFVTAELTALAELGRRFDCAVDVGSLHRVAPEERDAYAAALAAALQPGGRLYLWCVGEHERGPGGPARVTQAELRALFGRGWRIERIAAAQIEGHTWPGGANAWALVATRE